MSSRFGTAAGRPMPWPVVAVAVAGIVASALAVPLGFPAFGCLFLACGIGQMLLAYLLAFGAVAPGRTVGHSPLGLGLQACSWLILGGLFLVDRNLDVLEGVLVFVVQVGALLAGIAVEGRARREWPGP